MDEIKKLMELAGIELSNKKEKMNEQVVGDLQNGYDRGHKTTTNYSDYFPTGADSNVVDHTLPNGQGQNDNPMQKTIKDGKMDDLTEQQEIHKKLVYQYREYVKLYENKLKESHSYDDSEEMKQEWNDLVASGAVEDTPEEYEEFQRWWNKPGPRFTDDVVESNDDFDDENEEENLMPPERVREIEMTAESLRQEGAYVDIDERLPTISVFLDHDNKFFLQGEEASNLLDAVPDNVDDDDFILWLATGW